MNNEKTLVGLENIKPIVEIFSESGLLPYIKILPKVAEVAATAWAEAVFQERLKGEGKEPKGIFSEK